MNAHPQHPKHLPGTKWTSVEPLDGYRHWEVGRVDGDDVVLRSTLNGECHIRLPWRQLRNRATWTPGWE